MAGKKPEKRKYSYPQQLLDKCLGFLSMVLIVAAIFGITGTPLIGVLYLNFTNKVVGVPEQFVGFDNYLALSGDKIYWKSLYNTIIYTVGYITAKLALGLLLAVVLNQKLGGKAFFRTTLPIPQALPGMVAAITWRWMHDSTYDTINSPLLGAGPISLPISWLSNPDITLLSIVIANVWRGVPFFMLSLLGVLQTLNGQIFEVAYVDDADMFRRFWYITFPGISSVLGTFALLLIIWTFNDFESVLLIVRGGPIYSFNVVSTCTYDLVFMQNSFGRALSVAVSVISLMFILILVSRKVINGDRNE